MTPVPDIADHIVQAEIVRRKRADRHRIRYTAEAGHRGIEGVAPGKSPALMSALCSIFPFRVGWQPVRFAGNSGKPLTVVDRIKPSSRRIPAGRRRRIPGRRERRPRLLAVRKKHPRRRRSLGSDQLRFLHDRFSAGLPAPVHAAARWTSGKTHYRHTARDVDHLGFQIHDRFELEDAHTLKSLRLVQWLRSSTSLAGIARHRLRPAAGYAIGRCLRCNRGS